MVKLSTEMTENDEKFSKSKSTLFKYTGIEYIESCIKNGGCMLQRLMKLMIHLRVMVLSIRTSIGYDKLNFEYRR